jgi:hypothetical protein
MQLAATTTKAAAGARKTDTAFEAAEKRPVRARFGKGTNLSPPERSRRAPLSCRKYARASALEGASCGDHQSRRGFVNYPLQSPLLQKIGQVNTGGRIHGHQ